MKKSNNKYLLGTRNIDLVLWVIIKSIHEFKEDTREKPFYSLSNRALYCIDFYFVWRTTKPRSLLSPRRCWHTFEICTFSATLVWYCDAIFYVYDYSSTDQQLLACTLFQLNYLGPPVVILFIGAKWFMKVDQILPSQSIRLLHDNQKRNHMIIWIRSENICTYRIFRVSFFPALLLELLALMSLTMQKNSSLYLMHLELS